MSVITGDDVTYTSTVFLSNKDLVIGRDISSNSTDTTPTATSIASVIGTGQFYKTYIQNLSPTFTITLTMGTGFTMNPGTTDSIKPSSISSYIILATSSTTCEMYNVFSTVSRTTGGQTIDGAKTFTSSITMSPSGTRKITGLGEPTVGTDVSTKAYVDSGSWGTVAFPSLCTYCSTATVITGTPQKVPFNQTSFTPDTGLSILTTGGNVGRVTVTNAGRYEITYNIVTFPTAAGAGQRGRLTGEIRRDTGGGTTYTLITGSQSSGYMRELQNGNEVTSYACGKTFITDITGGTTLTIFFYRATGTVNATLAPNQTSMTIRKIGD